MIIKMITRLLYLAVVQHRRQEWKEFLLPHMVINPGSMGLDCGWWKSQLSLRYRPLVFDPVTLCTVTLTCHLSGNWRCGEGWGGLGYEECPSPYSDHPRHCLKDRLPGTTSHLMNQKFWRSKGPEIHILTMQVLCLFTSIKVWEALA